MALPWWAACLLKLHEVAIALLDVSLNTSAYVKSLRMYEDVSMSAACKLR